MRIALASGTLLLLTLTAAFKAEVPRQSRAPATGAAPSQRLPNIAEKASASNSGRKIPCKTPENAPQCYWTHGRLSQYEGNPTYRIWKIGTHRVLGVFNGPSHFPPRVGTFDEDVFNPDLPVNLNRAYTSDRKRWDKNGTTGYGRPDIFADFEVCPLEPERKGEMQAVCIESAKNVIVQSGWH